MSGNQIYNLIRSESLLDNTNTGVSYEWDESGWLHVHGTKDYPYSQGVTSAKTPIHLEAGDYVISAEVEGGGLGSYAYVSVWPTDDSKSLGSIHPKTGYLIFSVAEPADIYLWCCGAEKGATVDYRMRYMLVEGTTPAAWAPAEGESLPGGGCSDER